MIAYDASRKSLLHPGEAENFFQLTPVQDDAALCAEMSRLAYVNDETLLELYLSRADFRKKLAIGYNGDGTQLFIACKYDNSLTVVAFRGTEPGSLSDLLTNARFIQKPWVNSKGETSGHVHGGFADALKDNDILKKIITCLDSKVSQTRLLLTGHSLGAALATLTASWMPTAHLYTFGSPRVGDASFVRSLLPVNHSRFVDCCDLVTRVPPLFGYVHSGILRYIDRNGQLQESPNEEAINADRKKARILHLARYAFLPGNVFFRGLADHAPINYLSGVTGFRMQQL